MKVFLAAPFTTKINKAKGLVDGHFKEWIENIANHLRVEGHEVFFAHEREEWGARLDSPEVALKLDWKEIQKSDIVLAYIGNPPSPGVQMELGYASAFKKPIIAFTLQGEEVPYLARGLGAATTVRFEQVDESKDAATILAKAVGQLKKKS